MQQVGRYQIIGELGRGAMGIVYKAQDPAIGRTIAIKSIRLQDLTDEAERGRLKERLFREAQSAGMLSHPGIVTIYDIAEENGMAYIFMEFVNGPPLEKMLLAAQTPDKDTLISIFRQTAAALDYAHKKGIIHRDIKPANIMIHEDGTAKITDFGVAKIVSQQMTQAGTMMGTPSYMSPEQVQGTPITGRADQFSLAVIVYEALTGEKPFAAEYLPTLLYKIVREEPVPPQRLNLTLGPPVEAVLSKALAKNGSDRYETCADFIAALTAACATIQGWTPLPRGTSQNMPTVGSGQGLAATVAETVAERLPDTVSGVRAPLIVEPRSSPEPSPAPIPLPPPRDPRLREPRVKERQPNHVMRNVILAAAAVTLVCIGAFVAIEHYTAIPPYQPPNQPAATARNQDPSTSPPVVDPPVVDPRDAKQPEEVLAERTPVTQVSSVPRSPAPPGESAFQLTVTPPGATATFDGNADSKCTTPCSVNLAPGRHTFLVGSTGYRDEQRIIDIPHDAGLIVNLERLSGMLHVTTTPSGLTVVIDGQEESKKTPATFALAPGPHKVEVVKGGEKQEFAVDIHDGTTVSRAVDWAQ